MKKVVTLLGVIISSAILSACSSCGCPSPCNPCAAPAPCPPPCAAPCPCAHRDYKGELR